MDPCLSSRGIASSVLFLCALLLIKSVLSPVDLPIPEELVLRSNCVSHSGALEELEKLAVRNYLTLKNSIKPQAFLAAEGDRLRP